MRYNTGSEYLKEDPTMYDAAVIGTGPAGVSAVLNLQIHKKNFIWLGSKNLSDKISKAEQVSNYPGFIDISGADLNAAFKKQVEAMGIEITEKMVTSIMPMGDYYALMAGNDFYEAKTLIITTGIAAKNLLEGESDYVGRGVSYCATCDGNLYKGKTIAVVCNNPRFEHEVKYLADLAGKVYYFPRYKVSGSIADNVTVMDQKAKAVQGGMRLDHILLSDGESLAVDGLFVLRDAMALSTLLPGLASSEGHIIVDRAMATNLPGVFAAGDCTGRPYQYTKAVGEGNVAAHSVIDYLAEHE